MKKTFIFGFIFCSFIALWANHISAQEYKYDLNKYYTPDIVRNQLDLSFFTNNSFNDYRTKTDTIRSAYSTQLNGTIAPNFVSYTNTRQRVSQLQINGQFTGNYSANRDINQSNSNKNFQTSNYLNLTYSSRFYNSSNKYLLLGISSNFQATLGNNTSGTNSINSNNYNNQYILNIYPAIGIGVGRIESVEDARQAIYILDDFSKKGVLTRQLNNNEIFQLSQLISRVKNKRFLDARLHLTDEITSIDSFFVSNKLLDKSGAPYFTSLYDNWQYGALYSRKSGQLFEITFTPSYNWNYENDSTVGYHSPSINRKSLNAALTLTYTYEKPINLNWQHSVSASLKGITSLENNTNIEVYNINDINSIGALTGFDNRSINLNGSYTLGFYPSTRTYFSANVSQHFQLLHLKGVSNYDSNSEKSFESVTSINFNTYYYLSQQLRLSFRISLINNYGNESIFKNSSNYLHGEFGGTLSYSFF